MCRIAAMPAGIDRVFSRPEIVKMLVDLERSKGGHGNGFYFFARDQIFKSVNTPINHLIKKGVWKHGFLFHTRLATHGDKVRRNCHPFRIEDRTIIVHNGVWNDSKLFKSFFKCKSDTDSEILGHYLLKTGFEELPGYNQAVLIHHMRGGKHRLYVGKSTSGDLKVIKKDNYCWIASQAPADKDMYDESYEIKAGLYDITADSEGILTLPSSLRANNYRYYNNGIYDGGNYNDRSNTHVNHQKKVDLKTKWWGWGG